MTQEECIALLDRYSNYNGMGIPNLAGCKEAMKKAVELLSVKPSEDLEKYASRAGFDYVDDIESKFPGHRWNDHDVEFAYRDGIIAGAEWQAERLLKGSPMPENTVIFQKGIEEGKRLMMEEAVEGKVFMSFAPGHNQMVMADVDLPTNTKVKIVIVKEDKE